jgi:hypothetical protein
MAATYKSGIPTRLRRGHGICGLKRNEINEVNTGDQLCQGGDGDLTAGNCSPQSATSVKKRCDREALVLWGPTTGTKR